VCSNGILSTDQVGVSVFWHWRQWHGRNSLSPKRYGHYRCSDVVAKVPQVYAANDNDVIISMLHKQISETYLCNWYSWKGLDHLENESNPNTMPGCPVHHRAFTIRAWALIPSVDDANNHLRASRRLTLYSITSLLEQAACRRILYFYMYIGMPKF